MTKTLAQLARERADRALAEVNERDERIAELVRNGKSSSDHSCNEIRKDMNWYLNAAIELDAQASKLEESERRESKVNAPMTPARRALSQPPVPHATLPEHPEARALKPVLPAYHARLAEVAQQPRSPASDPASDLPKGAVAVWDRAIAQNSH